MSGSDNVGDGMIEPTLIGGRYRVQRRLGAGTYGCIYEALGPEGIRVAVKVIRERLLVSDQERARFEREAHVLRRFDHHNIVRVLDSGCMENATPYIVFELLEGRSLSAELQRVRYMSATRVAGIARQILHALAHAHRHGVIHRDIKPANVHLCRSAVAVDVVKVLDFGVAKPLAEGELERLTDAGALVGTPGYMAPEQIRGEAVGPPADLFALGMTMARLTSGERFVGDSLVEVIRHHLTPGPIRVPRAVALSELGGVIVRALRKAPEERYQTADEMLEAIDEVVEPSSSAPTSAAGTVLMSDHLDNEVSPSSTVPLDDMPWLRRDHEDDD